MIYLFENVVQLDNFTAEWLSCSAYYMTAIVTDLSDEALKGIPFYKLNVLYPLWLDVYLHEAYIDYCNSNSLSQDIQNQFKDVIVVKNMVTHLAITDEEHHELQQKFNMLLEAPELRRYGLDKVADTLFYTCLHFNAILWTDSDYRIRNSSKASREDYYPSSKHSSKQNLRELSTLLMLSNTSKNKHCITDMSISINGIPITFTDEQLRTWIVSMIEKSILEGDFPLGALGEDLYLLYEVLKKKNTPVVAGQTDMIDDLRFLSSIPDHKYDGEQSRIIRRYCMDIHKMFSQFMNQDHTKYMNTQLRLYTCILKLFKIYDFTRGAPSASGLADRLRSVISRAK